MPNEPKIVEHTERRIITELGQVISYCSCNMEWTHPRNRHQDEIDSIFESHKKYFNKPKSETL